MNTIARPAILLAASILVALASHDSFAQGTAIGQLPRLYVFTQVAKPGEAAAPGQDARQESVKDLREDLRKKPRFLEVVDVFDKADVTVEVLSRDQPSPSPCMVTVRLRVVASAYVRQFQGESRTCRDAATLVSDILVRWVNERY